MRYVDDWPEYDMKGGHQSNDGYAGRLDGISNAEYFAQYGIALKNKSKNKNMSRNYSNSNGNGGGRQVKHRTVCKSGVFSSSERNNVPYVRGWRPAGIPGGISYFASPTNNTDTHKSGTGREWDNWMVKIKTQGREEYSTSGLYDRSTGRVIVKSEGIVMNPRTNYCGPFGGKK